MLNKKNDQVVVLIMAYRSAISTFESISLKQCLSKLNDYPITIVKPHSVDISSWPVDQDSVRIEIFPDHFFRDVGTYSRLLLSPKFYRRFQQYEYMLIYQLDAFVFSDDLNLWCKKGMDYIGAPWFENFSVNNENAALIRAGNGGFSLRNIKSHLKVLHSFSYLSSPGENWRFRMKDRPKGREWITQVAGFLLDLCVRNNTFWLLNTYMGFEDQFWSLVAAKNFKWFNLPDPEEALNFSFEMQPRRLYDLNNQRLPFGCHAWWKYDLEFWKPHIEKFGYRL